MPDHITSLNRPVRVLIEGPDLTGKSTIASALAKHLRRDEHCVEHLNGKFHKWSWSRLLRCFDANQLAQSNLLNSAYIASAILDRFTPSSDASAPLVICESYVDRAIAYGTAIQRNPIARLAMNMPWLFPRVELAVFLTCPYEIRLERLALRPAPTHIDKITCDSHGMHDRFIAAYKQALSRHKNLINFDTSTVSVEEIVHQITCEVERLATTSPPQPCL